MYHSIIDKNSGLFKGSTIQKEILDTLYKVCSTEIHYSNICIIFVYFTNHSMVFDKMLVHLK